MQFWRKVYHLLSHWYPPDELHIGFKVLWAEVSDIFVVASHDVLQGILEPEERIDFMLFADGKEGIDHGSSLSSIMRTREEIVFSTQIM